MFASFLVGPFRRDLPSGKQWIDALIAVLVSLWALNEKERLGRSREGSRAAAAAAAAPKPDGAAKGKKKVPKKEFALAPNTWMP